VRYAMVYGPSSANLGTNSQIQQVAVNAAPSLNLSTSNIMVRWSSDANLPSKKDTQVKISYDYRFKIPLSLVTLTLTATSQMLVSQ
jgi:hypothetical protein